MVRNQTYNFIDIFERKSKTYHCLPLIEVKRTHRLFIYIYIMNSTRLETSLHLQFHFLHYTSYPSVCIIISRTINLRFSRSSGIFFFFFLFLSLVLSPIARLVLANAKSEEISNENWELTSPWRGPTQHRVRSCRSSALIWERTKQPNCGRNASAINRTVRWSRTSSQSVEAEN